MRVRFAPSPTGYLHIGGLRTALYNVLLAKRHGGTFVLRIEDTDQARFVEDAEKDILDCLTWAGLMYDEGPGVEKGYGPYRQSERSARYQEVADELIRLERAYYAFDTVDEIEALKARHTSKENPTPRYDVNTRMEMSNSLTLSAAEVKQRLASGMEYVVRLKVEPGQFVSFDDAVRGKVSFESGLVDDQVLVKSDGLPTYHLANIVDDHDMEITHVIRGEEWLSSTPKHILLYEALGWTPPQMAHLPLILSPTGGKLSKRNAEKQGIPVSVRQYIDAGYEPEALVNFLALLGWNPGNDQELMTLTEMAEVFSLDRVGSAGVQFDLQKLSWFNEHYLRARSAVSIAESLMPQVTESFGDVPLNYVTRAVELMLDRMSFEKDLLQARYLFSKPDSFDEKSVQKRWKVNSGELLLDFMSEFEAISEWNVHVLEASLKGKVERDGIGLGSIMFPIRLALTGEPSGPDLFGMMELLGKDEVLDRMNAAANVLA